MTTTTQNDSISVPEVLPQKPDWDAASEAMRWLNDIEAMQGGRIGPSIKLRAAIKAMQTEAEKALYMVRADKAQTLMAAEKAMRQIREATAKVVKERDEARAEAAALHSLLQEWLNGEYDGQDYLRRVRLALHHGAPVAALKEG